MQYSPPSTGCEGGLFASHSQGFSDAVAAACRGDGVVCLRLTTGCCVVRLLHGAFHVVAGMMLNRGAGGARRSSWR